MALHSISYHLSHRITSPLFIRLYYVSFPIDFHYYVGFGLSYKEFILFYFEREFI